VVPGTNFSETVTDLKNKGAEPVVYEYQYDDVWKDKLVGYGIKGNTKNISYDVSDVSGVSGNPKDYLGKTMEWNYVNNSLTSVTDGDKKYEYTYLSEGQRISKKANGTTTKYIYNAGMLLAEETENDRINYYYDADGIITEIGYLKKNAAGKFGAETYYFFTRNGQGDIVGVYRCKDSTLVGTYSYDLWGNIVSVKENSYKNKNGKLVTDAQGILNRNPLRYRGYYYDKETGFYYLNARYYDPKVHRFINADSVIAGVSSDVSGYNLFTYCDNDPVNKIDTSGNWPQLTNKQKVAVGLAVIGVAAVLTIATGGAAAGTVVAAVNCFATGALEGAIVGAATGAVSGAAINGGIAFIANHGDLNATKQAAIDGACDGFMSGAITGFITGGMTSNHCFVAGTLIETADGSIPIEQMQEGDLVLSQDPDTGDITYKHVLETYINETTELVHLTIDDEEIVTTPAHPFYVKDMGFVLAGDLEVGTTLIDSEGNELHLQIKRWEQLQSAISVYNFAVEDYHTYFVGSTNVLVHNICAADNVNLDKSKGYKTFKTLKNKLGSPGEGNEWHHIVEQCQSYKSGFAKELINNPDNMISLSVEQHRKISAFYSSIYKDTGLTFRNWLAGKDIVTQYQKGLEVLKMLGVTIP
jgi:RHS repeat-associated protein